MCMTQERERRETSRRRRSGTSRSVEREASEAFAEERAIEPVEAEIVEPEALLSDAELEDLFRSDPSLASDPLRLYLRAPMRPGGFARRSRVRSLIRVGRSGCRST
jgi:hypothetical protein